ncbi:F0F1 ATP synthase subunit A [Nannocystis pusilla]|uniref:F0F1 ATP synthase subunit A n=1 Tax=Nannocystis pusilla TaxID=889268 RepID=UPI003B82B04B
MLPRKPAGQLARRDSPRNFGLAAMVDGFVGVVYDLSVDVMGEDDARRFLPLTGTLAMFVFVCNIQGLIPGLLPPTFTLKTNLVFALIAFLTYNVVGVMRNGFGYFARFLGPKIGGFPWLFPLLLPVELVHHLGRPVSLSLRLTGNIVADHKVIGLVALMAPLFVPVPFLLLGTVVAIVQTLVFTLLTIIFIGLAAEPEEH